MRVAKIRRANIFLHEKKGREIFLIYGIHSVSYLVIIILVCLSPSQAIHGLINGVDALVCTPPSLLRLLSRNVMHLRHVSHLVSSLAKFYILRW